MHDGIWEGILVRNRGREEGIWQRGKNMAADAGALHGINIKGIFVI